MFRIQLEFPEEQVAAIDALVKETRASTRKELFNNALTVFQWAVKAKRDGRIIAAIDESDDSAKELVMPALENISATKALLATASH